MAETPAELVRQAHEQALQHLGRIRDHADKVTAAKLMVRAYSTQLTHLLGRAAAAEAAYRLADELATGYLGSSDPAAEA